MYLREFFVNLQKKNRYFVNIPWNWKKEPYFYKWFIVISRKIDISSPPGTLEIYWRYILSKSVFLGFSNIWFHWIDRNRRLDFNVSTNFSSNSSSMYSGFSLESPKQSDHISKKLVKQIFLKFWFKMSLGFCPYCMISIKT